ncbi:Y-family DNA polymerase [Propionivibrio sp.]|uniref:Y-family DNA polymerase n=1 Tax=Propionivibrio sp. TaxID=2212460 RepID=UPI003BF23EED
MPTPVPIFALVDCNNFYASCEKLFNPKLAGVPVVVLSNNDGCVVARSAEVKALGIPMGVPWFKIHDQARQHGIVAFSSNYALYADMSNRVMEVLAQFSPDIEVYSIDESFLDLAGFESIGLAEYGRQIRERIQQWLGLAVCVGIARSKTLAKLANHCAKKNLAGANGVCDFTAMSAADMDSLLDRIDVAEVWGVGRKLAPRLDAMGIRTVRALRDADANSVRARFSVVLERTVRELRGTSCLALEEVAPAKQQIICSRSFGQRVHDFDDLQEAVASYISRAAEKLRQQDSLAGAVTVHIQTSPFNLSEPRYQKAVTLPLPEATADSRLLARWALLILKQIYRPGFAYQKAGVMLSDICPRRMHQPSLFGALGENERLMRTLDRINSRWGRGTLRLAAEGMGKEWQMKRGHLSPGYTTEWAGLPTVQAR